MVGEGVIVAEAVMVGVAEIRRVGVGVDDTVGVGIVRVGKGPSRASAVPAIAVLIPSTPFCEPLPRPKAAV